MVQRLRHRVESPHHLLAGSPSLPARSPGRDNPATLRPTGSSLPVGRSRSYWSPHHANPIVTGPERLQLQTVAEIMRRIEAKVDSQGLRIHNIEIALATQEGGDIADARNAERRTSESRWRKGVATSIALALVGVMCSVALGIANLALNSGATP